MAQISQTSAPLSYQSVRMDSSSYGEHNDCTVVAVALLAGVTYAEAHKAMRDEGRKNGKGAYCYQYIKALESFGKKVTAIPQNSIISTFPSPHCNLRSLTTHHPRRFPKVWPKQKKYLVQTKRHALAIINGETMDWSINKSLRVCNIWEVE